MNEQIQLKSLFMKRQKMYSSGVIEFCDEKLSHWQDKIFGLVPTLFISAEVTSSELKIIALIKEIIEHLSIISIPATERRNDNVKSITYSKVCKKCEAGLIVYVMCNDAGWVNDPSLEQPRSLLPVGIAPIFEKKISNYELQYLDRGDINEIIKSLPEEEFYDKFLLYTWHPLKIALLMIYLSINPLQIIRKRSTRSAYPKCLGKGRILFTCADEINLNLSKNHQKGWVLSGKDTHEKSHFVCIGFSKIPN